FFGYWKLVILSFFNLSVCEGHMLHREHNLPLFIKDYQIMVEGSGPDGRVMKADILRYHEQSEGPGAEETGAPGSAGGGMPAEKDRGSGQERELQAEGAVTEIPLSSIRKTIARNMLKSKQSAAHMSLFEEVEISELVALRQRYKEAFSEKGIRLTYLPFFLKAAARALSEYPAINSKMDTERDRLIYKKYYNIGIAVDTDDGLVVPVIRHVDRKEISEIAAEIEEKARKARERSLTLDDFRDGTFTITSYGSIGGLWGTAVINYPQAGILGIGRIHQQPVVRDGAVAVGTVLPVSLTVDHRIVDGGTSSRFVNAFLSYVKNPVDMFVR
ncbi:MAG: dihydrolipoamide acetyltransferase family protein, partial [Spirochaetota bacterium]|nr:dihydrolipoamide acetyltransferase family protein [Spirochaetota bacterium]